jgi:hypothetical protein
MQNRVHVVLAPLLMYAPARGAIVGLLAQKRENELY